MAFGDHWEWRGFGIAPAALLARIRSLPAKFPCSQDLVDEYLWVPGSPINVKLRLGDLKFKRLLARSGECERWREDMSENHAFPIEPAVLAKLLQALGLNARSLPARALDRAGLLAFLAHVAPGVRLVSVAKSRWQHDWPVPAAAGRPREEPVTVEVAIITAPEKVISIGMEHPDLECLRAALEALGAHDGMLRLSYLDAVAAWGAGRSIVVGDVRRAGSP